MVRAGHDGVYVEGFEKGSVAIGWSVLGGLTQPRIKAEVKHRNGLMGTPVIRGFIGALREGGSGLFVSTGGYS